MVKVCSNCGAEKALTEFNRQSSAPDGRQSRCRVCTKMYARQYRKDNRKYFEQYRKDHYEEILEKDRIYREKTKQQKYAVGTIYRKNNRHKICAHAKVNRALKSGKLVRPETCEECGSDKHIQGHHDDYSKPLDVRWLCSKCHVKVHNNERFGPESL